MSRQSTQGEKYMKGPVPQLERDVCAYLAGLFDGEGCFTLNVSHYRGLKIGGSVRIAMTHYPTMLWIASQLGRPLQLHTNRSKAMAHKWKQCWRLDVSNVEGIISLIDQILPFLITKKEAAALLLEFCHLRRDSVDGDNRKGYGKYGEAEFALCDRIRALNKRGPEVEVIH